MDLVKAYLPLCELWVGISFEITSDAILRLHTVQLRAQHIPSAQKHLLTRCSHPSCLGTPEILFLLHECQSL